MGDDGFIIFGAKSCLILQNNRGHSMPPRQLTYIFDPTGNRVKTADGKVTDNVIGQSPI